MTTPAAEQQAAARQALLRSHGDYRDRASWLARLADIGIATPPDLAAQVDTVNTVRAELDQTRAATVPNPDQLAAELAAAKNPTKAIHSAVERITGHARTAEAERALTDLLRASERHAAHTLGTPATRDQLIGLLQPVHGDLTGELAALLEQHPDVVDMTAEAAIAADLAPIWQRREQLTARILDVENLGHDIRGRGPKGRFDRIADPHAAVAIWWDHLDRLRKTPNGDLIRRAQQTHTTHQGTRRGPLPGLVEGLAAGATRRLRTITETVTVLDRLEADQQTDQTNRRIRGVPDLTAA